MAKKDGESPIFTTALLLVTQMESYKLKLTPPTANLAEVKTVDESYVSKPLVTETIVTKEEPPKRYIVSYKPPQGSTNDNVEYIGESYEQCIIYAKRVTGINKVLGYAGDTQPEGYEPRVGAIALELSYGHGMVVESIQEDGIVITESNYRPGFITRRFVPYWDIKGYVY